MVLLLLALGLAAARSSAGGPADRQCDFAIVDAATAAEPTRFGQHVRQRQPTLSVGATAHWAATTEWQSLDTFAGRYADLQLPVRKPATTARGQSFRRAAKHVTLGQWARRLRSNGGRPPLVFDTNGSSGVLPAFGADIQPLPAGLAAVLKTSLFSLAGA